MAPVARESAEKPERAAMAEMAEMESPTFRSIPLYMELESAMDMVAMVAPAATAAMAEPGRAAMAREQTAQPRA